MQDFSTAGSHKPFPPTLKLPYPPKTYLKQCILFKAYFSKKVKQEVYKNLLGSLTTLDLLVFIG